MAMTGAALVCAHHQALLPMVSDEVLGLRWMGLF